MPSKPYTATSLERGLAVLKVLGSAGRPLRNRDVVASTGLPKATVSRLTNTLAAMGYLSRTDNGSYVPAFLSAGPGRAMLAGLELAGYATLFHDFFDETGGFAVVETLIGSSMFPVFRWSAAGCAELSQGTGDPAPGELSTSKACFEFLYEVPTFANVTLRTQLTTTGWCYRWDEATCQLSASTLVRFEHVGDFVLTLKVSQSGAPTVEQVNHIGVYLRRLANDISNQ